MKPKYFTLSELVPRRTLEQRGDRAWRCLDARALAALDDLRQRFGRLVINNYAAGGNRNWSGYRPPGSPYYSQYSQHSFGRAFDCLPLDTDLSDIQQWIRNNPDKHMIRGLELGVNWLHIDTRASNELEVFYP